MTWLMTHVGPEARPVENHFSKGRGKNTPNPSKKKPEQGSLLLGMAWTTVMNWLKLNTSILWINGGVFPATPTGSQDEAKSLAGAHVGHGVGPLLQRCRPGNVGPHHSDVTWGEDVVNFTSVYIMESRDLFTQNLSSAIQWPPNGRENVWIPII